MVRRRAQREALDLFACPFVHQQNFVFAIRRCDQSRRRVGRERRAEELAHLFAGGEPVDHRIAALAMHQRIPARNLGKTLIVPAAA